LVKRYEGEEKDGVKIDTACVEAGSCSTQASYGAKIAILESEIEAEAGK
jgi:1-aminocyclopropane-1-carboxylate deaminase/D-cysteine desulfhydrase-like pyridoxal-dependent ACC family enzyme